MSTYNGWANWETWNVHLWLSNDQYADEAMRDLCGDGRVTRRQAIDAAAELLGVPNEGFAADATNGVLEAADWREIIAAFSSEDDDSDEEGNDDDEQI